MALRPYQQEAVEFGLDRRRWIYGDAPGSGKTRGTLALLDADQAARTLLVVPNNVRRHWLREADAHSGLHVFDYSGTPKQRAKLLDGIDAGYSAAALVMNYELFRRGGDWENIKFDHIVFDEAHRLKGRKTKQTVMANRLGGTIPNITLVTGTPVMNHAAEVWSYLHLLNPAKYRSYWAWAHEHFYVEVTDFRGKLQQPTTIVGDMREGHDEIIAAQLAEVMIARTEHELHYDLPEQPIEFTLPVELTKTERAAYDSLSDYSWAEIGDELVVAENEIAKQTRFRQIASNWQSLNPDLGQGAKVKATVEYVNDLGGEQVVVLTWFKATARAIAEETGGVLWTGDENEKQRHAALDAFVSGEVRVFVGTLAAVGEGTDGLQVARHLVLVDRDWTPARNDQAVARLHRQGQTRGVVVAHVVAADTIDEAVAEALINKTSIIDAVMGRNHAVRPQG